MNTTSTEPRHPLRQAVGSAVTGAMLSLATVQAFSSNTHQHERKCAAVDGLCWTYGDFAVIPVTFAMGLIILSLVYKGLDIPQRLILIPTTVFLAPVILIAAHSTGIWGAATVAGGAWSCFLALTVTSRSRLVFFCLATALLFAAIVTLVIS